MDVADGTLFGQHALAYTMLAYAGIVLHRRVRMFAVTSQMLHVDPAAPRERPHRARRPRCSPAPSFPGFRYFIGSFVAGALWPFCVALLKLPQRPQPDPDHV